MTEVQQALNACFCALNIRSYYKVDLKKNNRKAMNRNWGNQKANPALKTKMGNK